MHTLSDLGMALGKRKGERNSLMSDNVGVSMMILIFY